MDHKLEATGAEIERQSKQIEGLRAENQELLDKVSCSKMDGIQHDEDMKELLDQCIQCSIDIHDTESIEVETEEKGISCCSGPEAEDEESDEDDEEGEDLLTLVRQYENHEEYLNENKEEDEEEEEEEQEIEDAMKEEEEEKGSKVINRVDLIAELLNEGLQREMEKNKKNGSSSSKKKGFWEFITSRFDSAIYWR